MNNITKWGFGMAPFLPSSIQNYCSSIMSVRNFVIGEAINNSLIDSISTVKGLFNRVIRQDQWDWFTVNMYLDYPNYNDLVKIVSALSSLRKAILSKEESIGANAITHLLNSNFLIYCDNFLSFDINAITTSEYLYILSRREEKEILKIGMTTRNVQKRVNEINSATGVLFPFFARKVYKVKDSRQVEKDIHALLSEYRIRNDREFFRIDYSKACSIIENYLTQKKSVLLRIINYKANSFACIY